MKKILMLGLVVAIGMQPNSSVADDRETDTIVTRLVMKFEVFKHYVGSCKDKSFNIAALEQKINQQILSKTRLTLQQTHRKIASEYADFETSLQDMKKQPCPEGFSSSDLQDVELSVNTTLERLSEADVLTYQPEPQEEPEQVVKVSETKAQDQAYQNANSVVLGQLIAYEQIPVRYRNTFVPESAKARYVYYLEKGWKGIAPRYAIAAEYAFGTNSSIPSDEMLNTKFLFYVNKDNVITEVVPVKDAKKLLKRLGEPHWYWAGGDLIRNKK